MLHASIIHHPLKGSLTASNRRGVQFVIKVIGLEINVATSFGSISDKLYEQPTKCREPVGSLHLKHAFI